MNFLSLNIYRGSYINSISPSALPAIRMEEWGEWPPRRAGRGGFGAGRGEGGEAAPTASG